ncbi:MAG: (2Fe-2S)-binding protein [Deltaproteobacteria bacterium]|nr:(2Fe-2S)-binding protein [Deltaproteobacteria bacterium]MBN2670481.1 (2Fe-2S)-binding protein [Deltaproteobacteria bacterium]
MSSQSYDKHRVPVSQRHMSKEASQTSDGRMVTVSFDGTDVQVAPGTTILDAAQRVGVRIPTLCTHEDLCVVGNCRICVVEVEGRDALQAACAFPVTESIRVTTQSAKIRTARQHMIQLLLAHHSGDCFSCRRNGTCELSSLAAEFGVDSVAFEKNADGRTQDYSSLALSRDMNKCVLCRRCVRACIDMQEVGVMEAVGKGDHIEIETFGNKPLKDVVCIGCGQCVARCPTAALSYPDETSKVWEAIDHPQKHVVIQIPVSVRASIGEALGNSPGTALGEQLVSQLYRMGFSRVVDAQLGVSLAIQEQAMELMSLLFSTKARKGAIERIVFSSNSSGWVRYMEHFLPTFLQYLSPLKSPEQLMGTIVRTHYAAHFGIDSSSIVSVAAVPCASKKVEAAGPLALTNGYRNIDYAITTQELAKMIRESGAHLASLPAQSFDSLIEPTAISTFSPFHSVLHMLSGVLFKMITGSRLTKEVSIEYTAPFNLPGAYMMKIPIDKVSPDVSAVLGEDADPSQMVGQSLVFGKCEGTANAKKVIEDICKGGAFSSCHYIEFLACPDGCLGGGGQPVPTNRTIRQARKEAFPLQLAYPDDIDSYIKDLHTRCLQKSLSGGFNRDHLFTSYTPRGKFIK